MRIMDTETIDLSLTLLPSAKHGGHVVWFSGGSETRREF